jgi:hypothetical protein
MATQQLSCESSLLAGEPLMATAPRTDVWMLLEHNAVWGAKALPESNLPEAVKSFFNRQLDTIPNSRFQFIKRRGNNPVFYVAISRATDARLYRFDLPLANLPTLDIAAIAAGREDYGANLTDETLFLVCTNGRRDICCARHGLPLYQAMSAYAGETVWQTTHLGGHRFAGTLVCLPQGIYYGRVAPTSAKSIIDTHHAGQIDLEHFRGRCGYDSPVQAAEHYIRAQNGITGIDNLRLSGVEPLNDQRWQITFTASDRLYTTEITGRLSDFEVYETTGNPEKARVTIYDQGAS